MRKPRWEIMEIADFGSCHWQPQRVESVLGEQKEVISQSEVCGFRDRSRGKPTRMSQALQSHFGSSCPTLLLSLMQQLRGGDRQCPELSASLVCAG